MLIFRFSDKKFFAIINQYICKFIHFSKEDNYALCKKEYADPSENGLFYYNLTNIVQNINNLDEIKTLQFKTIDIGCNTQLLFSQDEKRIGYYSNLSHITIVPLLHTNQIKFIGINKPNEYFAYKVIKDKFIAFHIRGVL